MNKIKELVKNTIEKYKKHSVIYTLVLAPIVIVLGGLLYIILGFTYINYIDRHAYDADNERIAKIIPFSQRGLPVPETDVPVTLPPDPGEAGKKTLAGIDSNNDGVRDDLEREIVYMYPQNEEVRRVLRAMVKKEQEILTAPGGDKEYFEGLRTSAFALKHCYEYKIFPIGQFDATNGQILLNMLENTSEREKRHRKNEQKATPFASRISFGPEACTQPLVKGQY
ncbi:MAG: hypothetical protein AAB510_01070 [Patescibacteria group bacterium]